MKFEIIDSENYFKTKKARNTAILLFSILMILIGRGGSEYRPNILQKLGLFDKTPILLNIIFIITGIYILVSYFYSRISKKIGKIEVNIKDISVETKNFSKKFDMEHIDSITIIQNTYVGDDYKRDPINNYYGNNWIIFTSEMKELKFEFKIDSHYKSIQLEKLINKLRDNNVNINYKEI